MNSEYLEKLVSALPRELAADIFLDIAVERIKELKKSSRDDPQEAEKFLLAHWVAVLSGIRGLQAGKALQVVPSVSLLVLTLYFEQRGDWDSMISRAKYDREALKGGRP